MVRMEYRPELYFSPFPLDFFFPPIAEHNTGEMEVNNVCSIGGLVIGERTILKKKNCSFHRRDIIVIETEQ